MRRALVTGLPIFDDKTRCVILRRATCWTTKPGPLTKKFLTSPITLLAPFWPGYNVKKQSNFS